MTQKHEVRHRGSSLITIALVMPVTFGFLAFAIDFGYVQLVRAQLQTAADSAALAASTQADIFSARRVARDYASRNGPTATTLTVKDNEVELGKWDASNRTFGPVSGHMAKPDAVRVTCRAGSVSPFFGRYFGIEDIELSATAIAMRHFRTMRIVGIDGVETRASCLTDSYRSNQSTFSPTNNGDVFSNGDIVMSGTSEIRGDAYHGIDKSLPNNQNVTGEIAPVRFPLAFPPVDFADSRENNDNALIPNRYIDGNRNLDTHSHTVTLQPGTYYLNDLTTRGGGSLKITGKTRVFLTGNTHVQGSGIINTTTNPSNLLMFSTGSTLDLGGSADFYGIVYGPTTDMTRSGSSDFYGAIIGKTLELRSSGGVYADESVDDQIVGQGREAGMLVK